MINAEIHAEQKHEHTEDHLYCQTVISGDTCTGNCKPPGSRSAESNTETVKRRHSQQGKEDNKHHGHKTINAVKYHGRGTHPGHQLACCRPWDLRPYKVHGIVILHGHHHQDKDQNPHPPYPVGKAAPEQHAVS